ncbi:DUF2750 domain-containing protein [Metabacillus sp. HB246100]
MDKEILAVIKLPANRRYSYFIKKIVDFEELWGLYNDGWAISEDTNGNKLIPLWPKKEYAELCTEEEWKQYQPKKIYLNDFINKWIPGMSKDRLSVSVFWYENDSVVVNPERLLNDIEEELENY